MSLDNLPERPEWQHQGLCVSGGELSEIFFPQGRKDEVAQKNQKAKDICRNCRVIDRCLDYALSRGEPYGTWGGLTEKERSSILRARSTGVKLPGQDAASS